MARDWTREQRLAIDTRNKSLLVSAAAGSGKTATLTQRIIESIIDEQNPTDISKMLIVTFTRAAVGELRDRIGTAIKERLAEVPDNKALEKQLMLLPSAKILTIDAFCNDCLKTFPDAVGINPGYRIADEAEMLLICREVFDALTESILRSELSDTVCAEDFEMLTDCLVDSRKMSDSFELFRKVYEKLRTTCDGIESLAGMVEAYNPEKFEGAGKTVFGEYIFNLEKEEFTYRAELFSKFSERLSQDPASVGNYALVAEQESEAFTRVAKAKSFEDMKAALENLQYGRFSTPRGAEKTELMSAFADVRDKEKKKVSSEIKKFFSYSADEWRGSFEKLYPLMKTLLSVLGIYDAVLSEKKRDLGVFDYTDIERLAYSALVKDGKPTDLAKSISEQYLYVYIDEYQDVNDLQDSIFRAISKDNNRFAVGDIKQSIYGFRSANPDIFANSKRNYPLLENAADAPAASLFMSKNFRSSEGVIKFVNDIFDKMFGIFADGIEYAESDSLRVGRKATGPSFYERPVICISPAGAPELDYEEDEENEDEYDSEEYEEVDEFSPELVATKIREILDTGTLEDGKPVRPSHIAIILRSLKGAGEKYVRALERAGVAVKTSGKKDFFMNADVLLALCLLNTIHNPLRDVYLTGLLRSPLFDFTPDELLAIRGEDRSVPFYHDLCRYTEEHPEFQKGKTFLATLERWRETAEGVRADKLLSSLFRETGLLALASEHGGKNNLIRLYEYARSYEGSGYGGVGSFITYINNVIAEGGKFDCNTNASEEDAVTIISAHSSKGLEYPIVFLADTAKRINNRDTSERLLFCVGFGVALRHRTPLGLALVDNPMRNAVAKKMTEANFEEELRILYVALTRAREKLFVVGTSRLNSAKEYVEKLSAVSSVLNGKAAARRLTSHLDIIVAASGDTPINAEELLPESDVAKKIIKERERLKTEAENPEGIAAKAEAQKDAEDEEFTIEYTECDRDLLALLKERFGYEYHSPHHTELPKKMSVSALYPSVLDGTEEPLELPSLKETGKRTLPEFIKQNEKEESKRRGIATHLFLQFCDLENLKKNGAENELSRLVRGSFISKEDAPRVRLSEINAFLRSELFDRMIGAKRLWREFRFNTHLPASLFTEDKEKADEYADRTILTQGVMDCIIESPDGSLSVVDYKTDRLSKEELETFELAEKKLRRSHEDQLYYYCLAAERIFGKMPTRAEVFSLHLGKTVNVMKKELCKK